MLTAIESVNQITLSVVTMQSGSNGGNFRIYKGAKK